jgi:membrane-bound lytic murein transglycosylase D
MIKSLPMYFRFCYYTILITLFSAGCASINQKNASLQYDKGAFSKISSQISADGFNSNLSTDILESNNLGYFLLEPDDQTWKAYYYFFRIRNQLFEDLVGELPSIEQEIPVVLNEKVQRYINYYQGRGRGTFTRWLARSGKYIPMMKEILQEQNMPSDLVYLAMIESGFNVKARSPMGAVGPWQFIPSTGKKYGLRIDSWVDERMNPEKSTVAAANYLKDLYEMFQNWELAAAGYNAGELRIQRALDKYNFADYWEMSDSGNVLPRETREYVPKIVAALVIVKNPEKYGFRYIEYNDPESFEIASVPGQRSLKDISKVLGISYSSLRDLNPSLIRNATPPGVSYNLRVPEGYGRIVEERRSELYALNKFYSPTYLTYRVKRGDTLGAIASRYKTRVSSIQNANKLRGTVIRVGQNLRIPTRYTGRALYASDASSTTKNTSYKSNSNPSFHTVRKGESLGSIANKYGVSVASLKNNNNLRSNTIYPGQKLSVIGGTGTTSTDYSVAKAPVNHKVRRGDTVSEIAQRYGVSIHSLKRENDINGSTIRVGQVLKIPRKVYASGSSGSKSLISHNVKSGDTLWDIANQYDVSVSNIKRWNNLNSTRLDTGDVLKIYKN